MKIAFLIKSLEPAFKKFNFKISADEFVEEWAEENKSLSCYIIINGTKYIKFEDFRWMGWGEAPMREADVINKELEKQGIDEKIYLIVGGNDGSPVFLSKELYEFMYGYFNPSVYKPLETNERGKLMGTIPLKSK